MGLAISNAGVFLMVLWMTVMWITFFRKMMFMTYGILYIYSGSACISVVSSWVAAAGWGYRWYHVLPLCYAMITAFMFAILGTVWQEGQQGEKKCDST